MVEVTASVSDMNHRLVGGVESMSFVKSSYPSFEAEFALSGKEHEDYVVHFYPPAGRENNEALRTYWLQKFPAVLSDFSQEYFKASPATLQAAYTEEVASWWFKAKGQAKLGFDPEKKIENFFVELDKALRADTNA